MDLFAILGILAAIATIIALIFQVMEYFKDRTKSKKPGNQPAPASTLIPKAIPNNLPPRGDFIGRVAERQRVHEALRSRSYLVLIDGIGGIGKTSLAREVAHDCLQASKAEQPDEHIAAFQGLIWTSAKDRELTLGLLVDTVARTLEYPGIAQQPLEDKLQAVRKLLQEKPYLLIVDNFETITDEGVRSFLLELPEPSKALVTSREQNLPRAWSISLKGYPESEALALIRNEGMRLGLASIENAPDALLKRLYQATGGAPLAIKWAVGQIKQKGQSLDSVLEALHTARGDIFDEIFARSWSLLHEESRLVLMVMPIFAAPAPWEAIEAASDLHHFALDGALGQLVEMSLLDASDELEKDKQRFSIHSLVRAFGRARLEEQPAIEKQAWQASARFYVSTIQALKDGETNRKAWAFLDDQLTNVLAIVEWCFTNEPERAFEIVEAISSYLTTCGHWDEALRLGQRSCQIALEAKLDEKVARYKTWPLSWVLRRRGDLDEAEALCKEAIQIYTRTQQMESLAHAYRHLGRVYEEQKQYDKAEEMFQKASEYLLHPSRIPDANNARLLIGWGRVKYKRGDNENALRLIQEALALSKQIHSSANEAGAYTALGWITLDQNSLAEARDYFNQALNIWTQLQYLTAMADAMLGIAQVEEQDCNKAMAIQRAQQALDIYQELGQEKQAQLAGDMIGRLTEG